MTRKMSSRSRRHRAVIMGHRSTFMRRKRRRRRARGGLRK